MSTASKLLSIAVCGVIEGRRKGGERRTRKPMHDELQLIPQFKDIDAERPLYRFRKIAAVPHRSRNFMIYPQRLQIIITQGHLTLSRPRRRPTPAHPGKVMSRTSKVRWCSANSSMRCWNGRTRSVVLNPDTYHPLVLNHETTTAGVVGEMVRELIVELVGYRFGNVNELPQQWLTDDDPAYAANDICAFGRIIGIEAVTAPAYVSESDGMAEALAKIFKRDWIPAARFESA